MVCNFLLTASGIVTLTEDVSEFDYFISSEDLNVLIKDKELLKEFIANSGKEKLIVRPLGDLNDGVYFMHGVEILKVGDKKW